MNRGTVMETGNGKAVVLTPDGEFVRIVAHRNVAIGDEISWTESQLAPYRRRLTIPRSRWMSAASVAAFLVLLFSIWSFRTPPVVAYVSMDINPSVEFGLDSHERVRELRAVNDDALPYIQGVAYQGKPIENVMAILARKLTDSHVLNAGDGEIVIASVRLKSVDAKWEEQVTDKIERILLQVSGGTGDNTTSPMPSSLDIEKLYLPVEVREEAKANGISSGKMAFWLAAQEKGHEVPLSSLQQESLKHIASSWGGVKQVLKNGNDHDADKETWKKLLAVQKANKKQRHQENHSPSPTNEQPPAHQDNKQVDRQDNGNGKGSDQPDDHHKQSSDDKKKQAHDKQKKDQEQDQARNDEKQTSGDDRQKSKPGKQSDLHRQLDGDPAQNDRRDNRDGHQRDDRRGRYGNHNEHDHGD